MRIIVAGASGVIGRSLVPMLVKAGHEVFGLIRNVEHAANVSESGARVFVADVFDREVLFGIFREVKPAVVINQLTSLRNMDFAETTRLRLEGTRNLVEASVENNVRKMITQSVSWAYTPGEGPADEDCPLDSDSSQNRKLFVDSIYTLEAAAKEMPEHVILRYGLLYGPGTFYAGNGMMADKVRQGKLVASKGVSSFVLAEDAARAALLALDWPTGPYNIVDDEPAAETDWLPVYAAALGAPEPVASGSGDVWERGSLNSKAVGQGWVPKYHSWREGFRNTLDL
ncbi:NAD(P)-dependent oxidoreductase [Paenibacillus psychroresistens]|uniref:NAD(P)-dependent oxidoreductase n=1 Tax=Paenibacillus psychroresistens TaxID=1778678 RepID=A0A6B8RKW9_9BACL|nr:NAD(P)-dependent oxidoreductase [Paenibacillus psychroresistens]QGQ96066.1 NAD(P)-dependent oxidoreductase [Paenibacillus psychroresistens]